MINSKAVAVLNVGLISSLLVLSSCTGEDWIGNVKNGVFSDYDKVKPVGEVYDNWSTCKKVEWTVLKESENFAEVQYKCEVANVDKVVSSLISKQKIIDESSQLRIRKLEKDIQKYQQDLKTALCKNQMFLGKVEAGFAIKRDESNRTDEELKSIVNSYIKVMAEAVEKLVNNKITNKDEADKYYSELAELSKKIEYGYNFESDIFSQGNPNSLQDESNSKGKEIQTKLLACFMNNESSDDPNIGYIGDERSPGDYQQISTLYDYQKELEGLKKQKTYSDLSKIETIVLFNVNKENFEINKSFSEFTIGKKKATMPHSINYIQDAIYTNTILAAEITKDQNIPGVIDLF